jgi:small GTP-binding protein
MGKTSLISRWNLGTFSAGPHMPTIGTSFVTKTIDTPDQGPVVVCVWDTAGQECFRSLAPSYSRNTDLVLLVTSIADEHSFESIPSWVSIVTETCEKPPPIVLLVNQMDKVDKAIYTTEEVHLTYDCQFLGIFFVSAQNGENVDHAFDFAIFESVKFASRIRDLQVPEPEAITTGAKCC